MLPCASHGRRSSRLLLAPRETGADVKRMESRRVTTSSSRSQHYSRVRTANPFPSLGPKILDRVSPMSKQLNVCLLRLLVIEIIFVLSPNKVLYNELRKKKIMKRIDPLRNEKRFENKEKIEQN